MGEEHRRGDVMVPYIAIVLAAGQGKRMKAGKNKQFIELNKKPLIVHTLERFIRDSWCQKIHLVVHRSDAEAMRKIVRNYQLEDKLELVHGGEERQHSSYLGLKSLQVEGDHIVMIHDGARPFIKQEYLHELAEKAKRVGAALLAVPVTDTIKQRIDDQLQTLNRDTLWAAQTPQAFIYEKIMEAHEQARSEKFLGTDDISLIERMSLPVEIVEGSVQNLKLTNPDDLLRAKWILEEWSEENDSDRTRI